MNTEIKTTGIDPQEETEREGCQLAIADDRLVNALQGQFPFILPLASFP